MGTERLLPLSINHLTVLQLGNPAHMHVLNTNCVGLPGIFSYGYSC